MPPQSSDRSHMWIKDISEKDRVQGAYLVKEKRMGTTRTGKPFISMTLADRTGQVEAKVWNRAQALSERFDPGHILEVEGEAESFRGQIQINISDLQVSTDRADTSRFLESAPGDASEMMARLKDILRSVEDRHLQSLAERFLADRRFVSRFQKAPAAKNFHHSYQGGLLEHTLSVCQMALKVADHYPQLDRDLLVTAAFLHDIGKMDELKIDLQIDYTDQGRLLGHVVMGMAMVEEKIHALKGFPADTALRLKHLILSHHGQYDFGSPKRPKFLEAFVLHLIDDLDAKINGLGRFMEKDRQEGAWTDFNRLFDRYFLKGSIQDPEGESDGPEKVDDRAGDAAGDKEEQGSLFGS